MVSVQNENVVYFPLQERKELLGRGEACLVPRWNTDVVCKSWGTLSGSGGHGIPGRCVKGTQMGVIGGEVDMSDLCGLGRVWSSVSP